MGELINGRTPEEIKRRLKCASFDCSDINCDDCEYLDICESVVKRGSAVDAIALIEHLEAAQPKWISVRDKLPKCDIEVLAISSEGTMRVCYYNGDWHGMLNSVDYWMPLPEPPKEDA